MPVPLTRDQISYTRALEVLPVYDELAFVRIDLDNCVVFSGTRTGDGEEPVTEEIAMQTIIRKDEAEIWQACNSLVQFHLRSTQDFVKGSFTFELISIDIYHGLVASDWDHLYQLIAKTAHRMKPHESCFVAYRSVRGILSFRTPLEWGKIVFSHAVRIFEKDPEKIDLYIKKLLKRSKTRYIVIHDISKKAIIEKENAAQRQRCCKLFHAVDEEEIAIANVIYTHADMTIRCNEFYAEALPSGED
jgi:hypothetical protein